MRHQPVLISGDDLCARINRDADNQRPSDWGVRPGEYTYHLVSWPEHVTVPQYDSDANYLGRVGDAHTPRGVQRLARRCGARVYGE